LSRPAHGASNSWWNVNVLRFFSDRTAPATIGRMWTSSMKSAAGAISA
jgi:hypothetical protein